MNLPLEIVSADWILEAHNSHVVEALKYQAEVEPRFTIRRFIPPAGYTNPNKAESMLVAEIVACLELDRMGIKPPEIDVEIAICALRLMQRGWPMYAVKSELVEDLSRTDPPDDLSWNDIEIAVDGATFLMPDTPEMREYFKSPKSPVAISFCVVKPEESSPFGPVLTGRSKPVVLMATMFYDTCNSRLNHVVVCGELADPMCQLGASLQIQPEAGLSGAITEADIVRQRRATRMAANLMAYLASGEYLESLTATTSGSACLRPAKVGRKAQDALYGVRWLGVGHHRTGPPLGGHHASPRTHWRRGCFRRQPYGKGRALRKVIWIRPVMVGADAQPVFPPLPAG